MNRLKGGGNDWFATGDRSTSLRAFKRGIVTRITLEQGQQVYYIPC
jgi:hypothetical protein